MSQKGFGYDGLEAMWGHDKASQMLGMNLVFAATSKAKVSMIVRDDMVNGHNTCHGGLIFALADTAFAFACNSQNQVAVAGAATIDYLHPAYSRDVLVASADVVHQGGRNGLYDVTVTNQQQVVIAVFRGRSIRVNCPIILEEST